MFDEMGMSPEPEIQLVAISSAHMARRYLGGLEWLPLRLGTAQIRAGEGGAIGGCRAPHEGEGLEAEAELRGGGAPELLDNARKPGAIGHEAPELLVVLGEVVVGGRGPGGRVTDRVPKGRDGRVRALRRGEGLGGRGSVDDFHCCVRVAGWRWVAMWRVAGGVIFKVPGK